MWLVRWWFVYSIEYEMTPQIPPNAAVQIPNSNETSWEEATPVVFDSHLVPK